MPRAAPFYLTALLLFAAPGGSSAQATSLLRKPFRVVLDPGHGGVDRGTVHRSAEGSVAEKEITLKLALRAAEVLRARGYSVILTRERDHEVELPLRTALANKVAADVFISVHLNAAASRDLAGSQAQGIETYILNTATDASSRRLAELENSVLDPEARAAAGDSDVALILKDLRLDANLSESKRLACSIQSTLLGAAKHSTNRGVRQALFYVLLGADMPSILVEAGFLSNPSDRKRLTSREGQSQFALALAKAIDAYRLTKEGHPTLAAASGSMAPCKVR